MLFIDRVWYGSCGQRWSSYQRHFPTFDFPDKQIVSIGLGILKPESLSISGRDPIPTSSIHFLSQVSLAYPFNMNPLHVTVNPLVLMEITRVVDEFSGGGPGFLINCFI
jgi:hypothetical protein